MHFVTWAELHHDVAVFASRYRGKIDAVVGIPRSGSLIASLIALHLNIPCDTAQALDDEWLNGFNDLVVSEGKQCRVLVVDDSVLTGETMAEVINHELSDQFVVVAYAALYASREFVDNLKWREHDFEFAYYRFVDSPRLFAWNWSHANHSASVMVDFDGILCRDPTAREDDVSGYVAELRIVPSLYLPTWPIRSIVTHRLEQHREIATAWLDAHEVAWGKLIMRPESSCVERRAAGQDGTWKGEQYHADPEALLFVESDPRQAERIAAVSHKPVYCPIVDRVF